MRPPTAPLSISLEHREALEKVASAEGPRRPDVRRARALLLAADGLANTRIAAQLGVSPTTVKSWRQRFSTEGLDALGGVRPGRGRKPQISPEKVAGIVHATVHATPPRGTRWSCRTMAAVSGVSPATVQRIWSAHGVKPDDARAGGVADERRQGPPAVAAATPAPERAGGQRRHRKKRGARDLDRPAPTHHTGVGSSPDRQTPLKSETDAAPGSTSYS